MRIGVYGGTFNPPHLGHMAAARAAAVALKLDRLILIPDAVPPHKPLPEGSPTAEERLELTRIAAAQARGVHLGRPAKEVPESFEKIVKDWETGRILFDEALKQSGLTEATFYRRRREIKQAQAKKR